MDTATQKSDSGGASFWKHGFIVAATFAVAFFVIICVGVAWLICGHRCGGTYNIGYIGILSDFSKITSLTFSTSHIKDISIWRILKAVENIRYESDDVIWLRNHASTWILVPNIGCKQTMASIPADRLLFFLVFTHFSFWLPQGNTKRRNFVIERNFEAANSRITGTSSGQLYKPCLCLGNFPKHVLPNHANPCYNANAPRQYPVPLPCTPHCISAVCFGEHMFNSRRSN